MIPLVPLFFKTFGIPVAGGLLSALSKNKDDFTKVTDLLAKSVPLKEALTKVLGDQYEKIIDRSKTTNFVIESDGSNYYSVEINNNLATYDKLDLLRTEFSVNIGSLKSLSNETEFQGLATTYLKKWLKRYETIVGYENESDKEKFQSLCEVLDPNVKNYKDLYNVMRPIVGVSGALTLIYAVLCVTGLYMGLLAKMSIFLFGFPGGQVAGLILLGSILAILSTIKFGVNSKIQVIIQTVYRFINEKQNIAAMESVPENKAMIDDLDAMLRTDELNNNINNECIIIIVGIFKYLSQVDNNITSNEIDVYKKYMKEEFAFEASTIDDYWKKIPPIDGLVAIESINSLLTENQKKSIFAALKSMTVADGNIHESERLFLGNVKHIFNID